MTVSLKHAFVSAKESGSDTSLVRAIEWNQEHVLTQATARLLGRTTAGVGATEEISVSGGLSLSAGALAVAGAFGQTLAALATAAAGRSALQVPRIYHPEMFAGDVDAAAAAAFAADVPLWIDSGTAYLDISPTADAAAGTPEARHTYLMEIARWQGRCMVGANARLRIRIVEEGLHTVNAWDTFADGDPVIFRDGAGPALDICGETETQITIASITIGTRGQSDFGVSPPIIRGPDDYPVTIVASTALPAYVVPKYGIGLRNIQGDNDAEVLTGAIKVETISGDRLTITGTAHCNRLANLVGPTVLETGTDKTYSNQLASRLVVPSACIAIDTSYTAEATQPITAVTPFSSVTITGITQALPGVVTAAGHGFSNGQIVTISGVSGMTEINNQSFFVTNAAADTFELYDLVNNEPFDTSAYTAYTSGGTARRPTRLTVTGHGYSNGNLIRVAGVGGMTQLNGRQFAVGTADANSLALLDMSNVGLDTSSYGAYTSGGTVQRVTEAWTGAADEGYFNFLRGGQGRFEHLSLVWAGEIGSLMDQDTVFGSGTGSFFEALDCVFANAGDKIVRLGDQADATLTRCCAGGRCEDIFATQSGATMFLVRNSYGGAKRTNTHAGDGSHITIAGCVAASGNINLGTSDGGSISALASKFTGSRRATYPVAGTVQVGLSTIINLCSTGLDGLADGRVAGKPTFAAETVNGVIVADPTKANATDSVLVANSIGTTTSGKGGARWIRDIAAAVVQPIHSGGTGAATAADARRNLLDNRTTVANVDYTILATDRYIGLTGTLTAPRTLTLPAANAVGAGHRLTIADEVGAISSTNTLTIARAGSDTVNGGTSLVLTAARQIVDLISNGLTRWTYDLQGLARGGTGASTAAAARTNLGAGWGLILPETRALINAMTTEPRRATTLLIEDTIADLIDAGLWAKLDHLWVMYALNEQMGYLDWKSPGSFTLVPSGGITFAASGGVTGNGTDGSISTQFTPSTQGVQWTLEEAHAAIYIQAAGTALNPAFGQANSNAFFLNPKNSSNNAQGRINDATSSSIANASARTGHYVFDRSAGNKNVIRDNALVGSAAVAATVLPSSALTLMRNSSTFDDCTLYAAHVGASLDSGTLIADLKTILENYFANL